MGERTARNIAKENPKSKILSRAIPTRKLSMKPKKYAFRILGIIF